MTKTGRTKEINAVFQNGDVLSLILLAATVTTMVGSYTSAHALIVIGLGLGAMAAFMLAFQTSSLYMANVRWLGQNKSKPVFDRLLPISRISSLVVACFVPVTYGTGTLPMIVVFLFLCLVNLWIAEERWLDNVNVSLTYEYFAIALMLVSVVATYLWAGAIVSAVVNSLLVVAVMWTSSRDSKKIGQYAGSATTA